MYGAYEQWASLCYVSDANHQFSTDCRGLKYVSKYRQERIRAIADYISLPKDLHAHASASAQNGLSLNHAGFGGSWNSQSTAAGSPSSQDSTSNGTDDEGTPLRKPQNAASRGARDGNGGAAGTADAARMESRWDVVCLQELWCSEDWEYMQDRLKNSGSGLIHGRYFWRWAFPMLFFMRDRIATDHHSVYAAVHLDRASAFCQSFPSFRLQPGLIP